MASRPIQKYTECHFAPGRCPPAGEGGSRGSLCPQLRILSTLADSQTSSHWRRRSQGQSSGISATHRVSDLRGKYNKTHHDGHIITLAVKHISRCIFGVQIWCSTHAKTFITASVACGKSRLPKLADELVPPCVFF